MLDTILAPLEFLVSAILLGVHAVLGPVVGRDSGWSWGPSIVVLVVVIRICLIPLFVRQIRAQRGLQLLQPRMVELRKKYGGDRQRQSEEMMKLYKETGTNPLSSCLPILAQSPFFFGLYRVLSGIAQNKPRGLLSQADVDSARKAHIFGAPLSDSFLNNTSSLTKVVTVVMIVAMCATQFITQRQIMLKNMPGGSDNPMAQQQKILLYVFPLVFAVTGVYFPVGVLLYWLTTNLWTMGQQFYVIRKMPAPGSRAEDAYKARLRAKGKLVEGPPTVAPTAPAAPRQQPRRQSRSARQRPPSSTGAARPGSSEPGFDTGAAPTGRAGPATRPVAPSARSTNGQASRAGSADSPSARQSTKLSTNGRANEEGSPRKPAPRTRIAGESAGTNASDRRAAKQRRPADTGSEKPPKRSTTAAPRPPRTSAPLADTDGAGKDPAPP